MTAPPLPETLGHLEVLEDAPASIVVPTGVEYPTSYDRHVAIDTIHDGWIIPERFVRHFDEAGRRQIDAVFETERDWGAHWVAHGLATRLGLRSTHRVTIARALLDFNRFPGVTPSGTTHLGRLAINPPFSAALTYDDKADLFATYYDAISHSMDALLEHRTVKVAVHTYDQLNLSGTERPALSLITRPETYQHAAEMPAHAFDPLFPHILGEFMASRVLTYRLALGLEQRQLPVSLNFPYLLPDGSVEVRSQVWFFFAYLRRKFEEVRAYSSDEERAAFNLVWTMLLDTNLRSSASVAFREYLHTFRLAPGNAHRYFARAGKAYEELTEFVDAHEQDLVEHYRYSKWRPSSLAIEVRKDFLFEMRDGRPVRLREDIGEQIVEGLADGLRHYLEEDLGVPAANPDPAPVG